MKFLFIYSIIFIKSIFFNVDKNLPCKEHLISIIKEYNLSVKNVKSNEAVYIHYNIKTNYRKNTNTAGVQEIKAYIGKEQSKVVNEYTEIYSNRKYTISVLPKDKVLLITNLPKNHEAEWRNNTALSMLDSIFSYYAIGDCSKVKNGLTQISLLPNAKAKTKYNVRSVEITIDENKRHMKSVKMNMANKGDVESLEMEYLVFETIPSNKVSFPGLPDSFVKNGKLTEKYKSFKLIDRTKPRS